MATNTTGLSLPSGVEDGVFPPMYYDSPFVQMVIGRTYTADDNLTAAVTVGAPYFTINKIDI
jgi:hypothetical protein